MQPITSYQVNNFLRVILHGPPKAGKSCLAMQFPKPYFIDLDVNLGGPLRFAGRQGLQLPVGYDVIDRDEKGDLVPVPARYARLDKLLLEAQTNPTIETIVIDSATNLVDILIAETLRKQSKSAMSKQEWGFFFTYGKTLMAQLTGMRKHIILTAHEKTNKNPDGTVAYPIKLAWPGQLGEIIGAFFTDVWRCESEQKGFGAAATTEYVIRTQKNSQYDLGNSLGLPALFKFDWKVIEEKLTSCPK